jgi:hypothetical protein
MKEQRQMKSPFTLLAALLVILGIDDLVMVPVMAMAPAHNQPPLAATVLSAVLGVVTLASLPGLARGRRWAFWAVLASRIVDALNSLMGAGFGPKPFSRWTARSR